MIKHYLITFLFLISVLYQKRYKRERKMRSRLQEQMENEYKKRNQIEEILKASGAPAEALRILTGNYYCYINLNLFSLNFPWQMLIFLYALLVLLTSKKHNNILFYFIFVFLFLFLGIGCPTGFQE